MFMSGQLKVVSTAVSIGFGTRLEPHEAVSAAGIGHDDRTGKTQELYTRLQERV
jgi:hypothetical protein